jgi:ABC-type transport system involved in multi-copper enzyme maturation permease subunit
VERRSVYSLLSKPIERWQLVLGKYAGLVLTLAVNLSVMAAALYGVLAYLAWTLGPDARIASEAPALDPALLTAIALTFVELAVVTAIAVFFSTFSTPILSAAFTFALFVAGRLSADLRRFDEVVDSPWAAALARGLYWILPNLGAFDVRAQVVHGMPVAAGYVALSTAYAAVYISAVLLGAVLIFARRDFK